LLYENAWENAPESSPDNLHTTAAPRQSPNKGTTITEKLYIVKLSLKNPIFSVIVSGFKIYLTLIISSANSKFPLYYSLFYSLYCRQGLCTAPLYCSRN